MSLTSTTLRSMMMRALFRLLRLSLVPALFRRLFQRRRVTLLLYHDPKAGLFEHHLKWLKKQYTIVPLKEAVEAVLQHQLQRLPDYPLVITFDDGHRGNRALLPLLERYAAPVTIFLCSEIVGTQRHFWFSHLPQISTDLKRLSDQERLEHLKVQAGFEETRDYDQRDALTWREVAEMERWVDFQSHTLRHPILPNCTDERAKREIMEAKTQLETRLNTPIYALSYPNGDYGHREVRLAEEAGYPCAITVEPGYLHADGDPLRMPRMVIRDRAGVDELAVKCSGVWGFAKQAVKGLLVRLGLQRGEW
ncbi:MAG: polysaccharide deacetylase family protein [Magnetococcales bacterium]|nr:polysaccharide deacetylase family protein [Magnetococcales bacterium]